MESLSVKKRLGVTLLAGLVGVGLTFIAAPGGSLPRAAYFGLPSHPLTLGELGLAPIFAGYLIAALVGWMRHGGATAFSPTAEHGRGHERWALGIGFGLTALFGLAATRFWFDFIAAEMSQVFPTMSGLEPGSQAVVTLSLLAGTALYVLLAKFVDFRGIGNGFEVLIGAGLAYELYPGARGFGDWLRSMSFANLDVFAVLGNVLSASVVILATLWVLRRMGGRVARGASSESAGVSPPQLFSAPTAGIIPVMAAGAGLTLLYYGRLFMNAEPMAFARTYIGTPVAHGSVSYVALQLAFVLGLGALCTLLFYRLDAMAQSRRAILGLSEAEVGEDSAIRRDMQRQRRRAMFYSLGYLALLVGAEAFGGELIRSMGVVKMALGTAVVLDLVGEARAWGEHGELVTVGSVGQDHAVTAVTGRLDRADIDYHVRGRNLRGMLHILAPFVPMTVLTRPADAERAQSLLTPEGAEAE